MMAAAIGRKNSAHASSQSVTDGAPRRALRAIHRGPTTATTFIATMSQRPRTFRRDGVVSDMRDAA
jgi:hypothetical protein